MPVVSCHCVLMIFEPTDGVFSEVCGPVDRLVWVQSPAGAETFLVVPTDCEAFPASLAGCSWGKEIDT
jgi:hypothetical protein